MLSEASPAVAVQQAVLAKQLHELKELRHTMQAMYDASQQEVVEVRAELEATQAEATRERERVAAVSADNASLRQWNEQLSADLQRLLVELRTEAPTDSAEPGQEAEEAEVAHLLGAAASTSNIAAAATGLSVDISVLQQAQLEASATALRLTHTQARLKRKAKELRASNAHISQLKETAQALSTDLAAATAQIGKLESRIRQQAETARKLEQLSAEHGAQTESLQQTTEALGRAKEEQAALARGPLAEAERRVAELETRERRSRALLERKVRQAAEMAAAVQTLGADSRVRIEENVKLRLLAQRLGATPKELENVRRSRANARRDENDDDDDDDEEEDSRHLFSRGNSDGAHAGRRAGGDRGGDLPAAWVRRAQGALGFDEHDDNDEFGSVASTMRSHHRPPSHDQAPNRRSREPPGSLFSGSGVVATSPGSIQSSGGPAEALQSQMALQEKLRKVRSTFADIRRQVGYE